MSQPIITLDANFGNCQFCPFSQCRQTRTVANFKKRTPLTHPHSLGLQLVKGAPLWLLASRRSLTYSSTSRNASNFACVLAGPKSPFLLTLQKSFSQNKLKNLFCTKCHHRNSLPNTIFEMKIRPTVSELLRGTHGRTHKQNLSENKGP